MNNPSSKYDAAENTGVINIITNTSNELGTNIGMVSSFGYGRTPKYNLGVDVFHNDAKLRLRGGYSYNHNEREQTFTIIRSIIENSQPFLFDQVVDMNKNIDYHSLRTGIDYRLNSRNSWLISLENGFSSGYDKSDGNTLISERDNSSLGTIRNWSGVKVFTVWAILYRKRINRRN